MSRKSLRLSEDLELAILGSILGGQCGADVIRPEEISKAGRSILYAAKALEKPTYAGVLLHVTEVQGLDKVEARDYLLRVQKAGSEIAAAEVLQTIRDKQQLVDLVNAASDMLSTSKGRIDLGLLATHLERDTTGGYGGISPLSERLKDGFPDPPQGLRLRSLPNLYEKTGGIHGSWVIGGEPKLGKTAMAWQVALDVSKNNDIPVIYYDLENSIGVMIDHTRQIYKGDIKRVREATARIYYRDSIRSLEADLQRIPPPALIVVDHVQRLPGNVEFRKAGLDRWIHRLDSLKKRGYTVLMISEIGRAQYNSDAYIGAFKETGEIEYAAETAVQLLWASDRKLVEVHVVANRHRPHTGLISLLQRFNGWAFREISDQGEVPAEVD